MFSILSGPAGPALNDNARPHTPNLPRSRGGVGKADGAGAAVAKPWSAHALRPDTPHSASAPANSLKDKALTRSPPGGAPLKARP